MFALRFPYLINVNHFSAVNIIGHSWSSAIHKKNHLDYLNSSAKLEKIKKPKTYLNHIEIRVPVKNKIPIIHSQFAVSSKASCFDQHLLRSGNNRQKENKNGIPHYSVALRHFRLGYILSFLAKLFTSEPRKINNG